MSEEAKLKLEKLLTGFQSRKPDLIKEVNIQGNEAKAGGKYFNGCFTVTDNKVSVEVELKGFAAKMAKGMVREQLNKQLDREFPKA